MENNSGRSEPPEGASFWELFDHFWRRGLGNVEAEDGIAKPWTAESLETAFDGSPGVRAIENWRRRSSLPVPDNLRKIAAVIAGDDAALRIRWYDALVDARAKELEAAPEETGTHSDETPLTGNAVEEDPTALRKRIGLLAAVIAIVGFAVIGWLWFGREQPQTVENIRICDIHFFDADAGACTQHMAVFVHGIDDVYLSFDFKNVPKGAPFERWWILDGERQAGRTSFNDEAWPGWTFWRPGTLKVGQYVVRVVVDGTVFTQTFQVQAENYRSPKP